MRRLGKNISVNAYLWYDGRLVDSTFDSFSSFNDIKLSFYIRNPQYRGEKVTIEYWNDFLFNRKNCILQK